MANNNFEHARSALKAAQLNNLEKIILNHGKNPKQCINIVAYDKSGTIINFPLKGKNQYFVSTSYYEHDWEFEELFKFIDEGGNPNNIETIFSDILKSDNNILSIFDNNIQNILSLFYGLEGKKQHSKREIEKIINKSDQYVRNIINRAFLQYRQLYTNKEHNNILLEYYEGELFERTYLSKSRNKQIVEKVKLRDNYTCLACNFNFDNKVVEVHHLNPISEKDAGTIEPAELVTLCPTCHSLAHLLLKQDNIYKDKNILLNKLKKIHKI